MTNCITKAATQYTVVEAEHTGIVRNTPNIIVTDRSHLGFCNIIEAVDHSMRIVRPDVITIAS